MRIMNALENTKVLVYLHSIIQDYFRDWVVLVQKASGMIKKEMTCGVPQWSILGALLRNITSDDILMKDIPPGVSIICYINDTQVVTAEDDIPMLKRKINTALEAMTHWIDQAGLSSATIRRKWCCLHSYGQFSPPSPSFHLKEEREKRLCTALKYLRLWFDEKLTFKEHAKWTTIKAERIVANINWLMLNQGGPSKSKYKLLANVVMLVHLYGAPVSADAINTKEYRSTEMVLVQWQFVCWQVYPRSR